MKITDLIYIIILAISIAFCCLLHLYMELQIKKAVALVKIVKNWQETNDIRYMKYRNDAKLVDRVLKFSPLNPRTYRIPKDSDFK